MLGSDFSDDGTLVKALAAREPEAFAYLLDRYHAPLTRLARQYVPSEAVADEVVQETWLAVLEGIDRFEQRSSLKTWLFKILLNIARSRGVREHRSVPFAADELLDAERAVAPNRFHRFGRHRGQWRRPPQSWGDPERGALDTDALAVVRGALTQLPLAQREVVTMRDVLGWTAAEVCDALELSAENQRVLLHRGRSKLRAALERHYGAEARS